jgi:hypothetical protein
MHFLHPIQGMKPMASNAAARNSDTVQGKKVAVWGFAILVWIFVLEYSLYLVGGLVADRVIKLASFGGLLLMLGFYRRQLEPHVKTLLLLFLGILLSALIPSIVTWDKVGFVQWGKIAFMAGILGLLLVDIKRARECNEAASDIYLWIAAFFVFQAIVGFSAVLLGWLDSSVLIDIERRPGQERSISLGLFGLANAIQTPVEGVKVLRPQGWFIEPSILAAFLLYPAFASYARFRQSQKAIYRLLSWSIFLAIFMTFSLAGYFAVLAAVLFLTLSIPLFRIMSGRRLKWLYPIVILLLFVLMSRGIIYGTNHVYQLNRSEVQSLLVAGKYGGGVEPSALEKFSVSATKMLARDPNGQSGNLFRESYKLQRYMSMIAAHPIGIGFGITQGYSEINSGNAVVFWLLSGGVVAVTLLAWMSWYLFWTFCHPLLVSGNIVQRCVAASFLGHAIQNMSYGNFVAPFFLLHLAIMVTAALQLRSQQNSAGDPVT